MMKENINIPVKVGDTILTGRFKNKKVVVKSIGKDEHGMPTINGKKVVTFRILKEQVLDDTDLELKRGKVYVLQAEEKDYKRGLIVRLLPDGGYDVKYWFKSPTNVYPVEVFIDGKSVTKNGKVIKLGFHPELEESKRIPRKKGQHRGSSSHSDLYTDENPKGTIKGLKFATVKDAKASVNKIKSSGKTHAHKIQAAIAMEQRAKAAGKVTAAGGYRTYINKMKKKTKKKNEIYFDRFGNKCKNPTTLDGRCLDKYHPSTTIREPLSEIPMGDLQKIDTYADSKMGVDVVLTGKHFFDRLNDPRNEKEISEAELIGFFKRLSKNKKKFIEFLEKYKQIVATDNRTNINIPFMKSANKIIAKTVMRKDGFKTSNLKFNI